MADCCKVKAKDGAFDLVVIGAGSAGFSAAITAAGEGARVALIGYGMIGGTCVNVGCVPSKTMIRMAEALYGARTAERFSGITGEAHITDWQQVIAAKDDLVSTLRQKKYIDLLPEYDAISYFDGAARLTEGGVMVAGQEIHAGKIIIATGSAPALPDIDGIGDVPYLTSTSALELDHLPRSLMILGAGYIGCELAQMFARSGVNVSLITRSHLLPGAEPEISAGLAGYFEQEGIELYSGLSYENIRRDDNGVSLVISRAGAREIISADQVIVTTGRTANVENLGLGDMGIDQRANGGIIVDDYLRTSRGNIYAAGDVTGRDQFVYMAAYGAKLAALNALKGDRLTYDNRAMPWVVFSDPQVAGAGLNEAEAREAGFEVMTSILPLDQLPRALAARDTRGLIKLVADRNSDRLLGAQIMAPEGADAIQTAVLALKNNMTATELGATIFPYLTTVEGLKLAAQSFGKDVTKLSCCAG